jgi:hypothetical protein
VTQPLREGHGQNWWRYVSNGLKWDMLAATLGFVLAVAHVSTLQANVMSPYYF